MAGDILSLLKEVFASKLAEIEHNYCNKCEGFEKLLEKRNPAYRKIKDKINSKKGLMLKLDGEIDELEEARFKLFLSELVALPKAERKLKAAYLELKAKAATGGIPKEKLKKLVEDFRNKDFLAETMGV